VNKRFQARLVYHEDTKITKVFFKEIIVCFVTS